MLRFSFIMILCIICVGCVSTNKFDAVVLANVTTMGEFDKIAIGMENLLDKLIEKNANNPDSLKGLLKWKNDLRKSVLNIKTVAVELKPLLESSSIGADLKRKGLELLEIIINRRMTIP